MVYGSAIRDAGGGRFWICIDDLVATLFSLANDRGNTTEDTFTFGLGTVFCVSVENFGVNRKALFGF